METIKKKWNTITCLFLLAAFLPACSKKSAPPVPPFTLPAGLYKITVATDVGNNANASDIHVEAEVSSALITSDIREVRLVIVKSGKTFTTEQISSLATGNYFTFPVSTTNPQTIKPTSGIKDSDGDPVTNADYNAYIAVLGKENSLQLSQPKLFSLRNKPVYAGDYIGTWEDLGPPGPGSFAISMRIKDDYTGQLFYKTNYIPYGSKGTEDAKIKLTVTSTSFTFKMDQYIVDYLGGGAFGTGGGCAAVKDLTGTIDNDITLIFDTFSWADCDGTRNVRMRFIKQ